jgi:drug/metabolite transporter (DMT)-like permease
VACIVGLIYYDGAVLVSEIPGKDWFPGTLALGVLFILVFNIMARTSQKLGVSVASVATKMSLVIPVFLGVLLYNEKLVPIKVLGILLALAAVYFASVKQRPMVSERNSILLPLFLFLGSGIIDASIQYMERRLVIQSELPLFTALVFAAAALSGGVFIGLRLPKKTMRWNARNVLGGIALGVPNFFSIFFLLRALGSTTLNSASVFTLNNVAIVLFSTLLGILLFREKISFKNWAGISLAVISILMVALF